MNTGPVKTTQRTVTFREAPRATNPASSANNPAPAKIPAHAKVQAPAKLPAPAKGPSPAKTTGSRAKSSPVPKPAVKKSAQVPAKTSKPQKIVPSTPKAASSPSVQRSEHAAGTASSGTNPGIYIRYRLAISSI
jgi:hypothetical protein